MKKVLLLLVFILIFLFFPFPKNIGSQNEDNLNSARESAQNKIQTVTQGSFTFLPAPTTWPRPLSLIWQASHINEVAHNYPNISSWSNFKQMPPQLPQAIIAIEDHRFYSHSGVDVDSIFRALLANIQADEIVQGGSTITQQLIKNLLLTQDQTLDRKIWEVLLSLIVESRFSKDEILSFYLNTTYLGAGSYGVAQAAQVYFGKDLENINLAECATLAALPYAPSALNPFDNPEECKKRRNLVLTTMVKRGMITNESADNILNEPIVLRSL